MLVLALMICKLLGGKQIMHFLRNKKVVHMVLLIIVVFAVGRFSVSSAAGTEPGTADDPVVSQSYVDAKISDLNNQISALKQQLQSGNQTPTGTQPQSSKYEVVGPVAAGKKIIAGESTEIVLRGGKATAISAQAGGVADLIAGTDLTTGTNIPLNHLLLVPKDDGRGITITSEAWVLIRGSYTIK